MEGAGGAVTAQEQLSRSVGEQHEGGERAGDDRSVELDPSSSCRYSDDRPNTQPTIMKLAPAARAVGTKARRISMGTHRPLWRGELREPIPVLGFRDAR